MEGIMKKLLLSALLVATSSAALADTSTIVTQTKTWKNVPITVDSDTYVVNGTLPEGDFYYAYSGHRCFSVKRDDAGVDALVLHAKVAGGADIYCYPE